MGRCCNVRTSRVTPYEVNPGDINNQSAVRWKQNPLSRPAQNIPILTGTFLQPFFEPSQTLFKAFAGTCRQHYPQSSPSFHKLVGTLLLRETFLEPL